MTKNLADSRQQNEARGQAPFGRSSRPRGRQSGFRRNAAFRPQKTSADVWTEILRGTETGTLGGPCRVNRRGRTKYNGRSAAGGYGAGG